jgi:predicted outer membrane protein
MHRKFSLVAVLATILLAGCGSLESNELKDSVGTIHSAVQEGAILAGDAAKGRTTTNFVRAYAGQLSTALQHETEKLNDARPAQGVAPKVQRAIKAASDGSSALDDLRASPNDRAKAAVARKQLLDAAKKSDDLDQEL